MRVDTNGDCGSLMAGSTSVISLTASMIKVSRPHVPIRSQPRWQHRAKSNSRLRTRCRSDRKIVIGSRGRKFQQRQKEGVHQYQPGSRHQVTRRQHPGQFRSNAILLVQATSRFYSWNLNRLCKCCRGHSGLAFKVYKWMHPRPQPEESASGKGLMATSNA